MPRRHVDPEVKAAATAEALAGESMRAVARRHGVSHNAVQRWRKYGYDHQRAEQVNARVFVLILEGLDTLAEHLRLARDPAYVQAQPAHELAVFDGVVADKLLLLIRAVSGDGDGRRALPEPGDALDAAPQPDGPAG